MLETVWFVLWGILWGVYFMLDGFDLGLGTIMPFITDSDEEKRTIYNAMGPFWDGNEVWLVTAGGVTFAAFPKTYAVMFSALYTPLMLLLFALIIRAAAIEFRKEAATPRAKKFWDGCFFLGSFLPALLLGVAFANLFKGLPITAAGTLKGNLLTLLNPYGLCGGLLFVLTFALHGCLWLIVKTRGELHAKARTASLKLWVLVLTALIIFLGMSAAYTDLLDNYNAVAILYVIPLLGLVCLGMIRFYGRRDQEWKAWFASGLFILAVTLFGVMGMFPALIPSSINPFYSLTIENSASSPLTLKIMLGVVLVFIPLVIAYQSWVYMIFRHKLTEADLAATEIY